jgi:hypothetical protein
VGEHVGERAGECVNLHMCVNEDIHMSMPRCAKTSMKTFMLQIAVSRRPMENLKFKY